MNNEIPTMRVTVTLQNNRLIRARETLGLTRGAMADTVGVGRGRYGSFESMKASPVWPKISAGPHVERSGAWLPTALKIANFHCEAPEYFWPDEVLAVRMASSSREMFARDVMALGASGSEDSTSGQMDVLVLMDGLDERQKKLITWRFGMGPKGVPVTLDEIGRRLKLTRERVRQIEEGALWTMRKRSDDRLGRALVGLQ